MSAHEVLTARTKGLGLTEPVPLDQLRDDLSRHPRPLTDSLFSWPLLVLDDDAIAHNIACLADLAAERGVLHAPHVKTPMCQQIWDRQVAAGAWAATVATAGQMRTAIDWGARRVLLANELPDRREIGRLMDALRADPGLEVWLQIDSQSGLNALHDCGGADGLPNLRLLVEYGVPGGRTGVRGLAHTASLAQSVVDAHLILGGVTGYEAPAGAGGKGAEGVAGWCDRLIEAAQAVGEIHQTCATLTPDAAPSPMIVSAGGSFYLDVVLDRLAPAGLPSPLGHGAQLVIRSGAYVAHDNGHYARQNPLARLDPPRELLAATTVYAQVVSVPEPELAFVNAGRRDLAFDIDLPIPLWHRSQPAPESPDILGPLEPFEQGITVTELNDQHTFLAGPAVALLQPGDIVGLGISHPCTVFDKWRVGALTRDDDGQPLAHDIYAFDF